MSSTPSYILVDHIYAIYKHLPSKGEVIVVPLLQALPGPGCTLGSVRGHPSHANYHHAVVISIILDVSEFMIMLIVLPMPAYSAIDPISGLSSTSWLLSQPTDYQKVHIPVPHEPIPPISPFPTPAQFGDPIEAGGWKDRRPRWIQVVPMITEFEYTTKFKCYDPPVKLSSDEVLRLKVLGGLPLPPSPSSILTNSGTVPPFPLTVGGAAPVPDAPSLTKDAVPSSGSSRHSRQDTGYGGVAFETGGGSALQALYSTDAVKRAFATLSYYANLALLDDDDDDDDDDDEWEDRMDPITTLRYYAADCPLSAKIVQEHDDKMRERLNEGIASWLEGIQSETV